jgi:hypothetical protein
MWGKREADASAGAPPQQPEKSLSRIALSPA